MTSVTHQPNEIEAHRSDTALIQVLCGSSMIGLFIAALVLVPRILVIGNTAGLAVMLLGMGAIFGIGATLAAIGTIYLAKH